MTSSSRPALSSTIWNCWKTNCSRYGVLTASVRLVSLLAQFLRDSTPERLRQRYGDAEYDWDYRVNTTSAALHWRDRLLGVFHSPYQPTEPALFHEMLAALQRQAAIDFRGFTFLDFGSGKGRTLLMASDYPFRRIIGVELLPALHAVAAENIGKYHADSQKCTDLCSICADATQFVLPVEPLILYLFNPFPEEGLRRVLANIDQSLRSNPRPFYLLYHNPLLESSLAQDPQLRKLFGTHQFSIFAISKRDPARPATPAQL